MTETEIVSKLAGLGCLVMEKFFDSEYHDIEIDGSDMQEELLKIGLLETFEVTESCGDYCSCAEMSEWPQTCYRTPDTVRDTMMAMIAERTNNGGRTERP